jgi:hypothetical protein
MWSSSTKPRSGELSISTPTAIIGRELICPWVRMRRNRDRRNRRKRDESWQFRRSVASTIATNAGPPERMTAVDAVTSQAGVCLGNRFPTANIAKTACEPRTTAPRLPEANNHAGIQSATADLMWLPTGFAIGTVVRRGDQMPDELDTGHVRFVSMHVSSRFL